MKGVLQVVDNLRNDILMRLRTIKGHIAGIEKMVEEEKSCEEILLQIAAVKASLEKVGMSIIQEHAKDCILASKDGKATYEDVQRIINLLVKFAK
ncbi:DNA-binding FrmR family transcriptional regulator [Caldanaerobacter subterraneus]|uniref:DNA-binding FrmR family transcriptional regulator n=1 Tax=Caldanaerobacter subterraneus TaxID=911092 RepID=A0A4V2S982_9THEO|nr:DNA-binding FrmR family transcriptional regulator [Caldanaerobacter subterraneus]